jgi:hypothetical protein
MNRVAIVVLACSDYESLEVSLACQAAYLPPGVNLFILQNCRGTFDAESTLGVAQRYARLFPGRIHVVTGIQPGPAYHSLAALLASPLLAPYELVCKVDDDAFPIAPGWLEALVACYDVAAAAPGPPLAYVTPLINNNCWGFPETLAVMNLRDAYFADMARDHVVGPPRASRIVPAGTLDGGSHGTIWAAPHLARWLHERTTLVPDRFIAATRGLEPVAVPGAERYSINCILFRRELWGTIADGSNDDEHMLHEHCRRTGARIVCARSVPFVHIAYFPQREENRDLVEVIRKVYELRLGHPFPIAACASRQLDLEARLRWLEMKIDRAARREPERSVTPHRSG